MLGNQRIIDALNEDRSRELGAIMQYMMHHYQGEGMESASINPIFKETSIAEMGHAERLAERITYLGGKPTSVPKPMASGGDLRQMIVDDLENERNAIRHYREHIELCDEVGDSTSRMMLEEILSQEEAHAERWETLLGTKGEARGGKRAAA